MDHLHLANSLADAFNALADQVQTLTDRQTVLEHKLRFAHEQFQYLADKYAPAAPEIADTLAKLQLPPAPATPVDSNVTVPLPRACDSNSQHQIALVIRDGRRVANQLASLGEASKTTGSTRETFSHTSHAETSMSTTLEHDFTVEGKKGNLQCPFSRPAAAAAEDGGSVEDDYDAAADGRGDEQNSSAPPKLMDPICAALYEESTSQQARTNGSSAGKCPIRYMDKHSAEEIAHYVETHKHELPRSHEVCLQRFQRDEDQIKKIDSKYGDLVSMIEGLGQLHQPLLPGTTDEEEPTGEEVQAHNERVENWAQDVSANPHAEEGHDTAAADVDGDRQSHFDRPLKEIRVGESPSRPWGISVPPVFEPPGRGDDGQPLSPPPAPVRMPSPTQSAAPPAKKPGKCPFDHTKFAMPPPPRVPSPTKHDAPRSGVSAAAGPPSLPCRDAAPPPPASPPAAAATTTMRPQPTFISPDMNKGTGVVPQMIFTGPVFIGYPMDQAIQFMNQHRGDL